MRQITFPGIGTFYDFQKRLWLGAAAHIASKVRKPRRKPKKGKKKGEKSPLRKPGVVHRMVKRFLKHPPSFQDRPHDLLQQIMKVCFVLPSAKKDILGDTSRLSVAGDGTSVRTEASPYGKLLCKRRENRVFRCDFPRRFSDPDADWAGTVTVKCFFTGVLFMRLRQPIGPYDLPVYLHLHKASRHDSVAFVFSFLSMIQQYQEFSFSECILDSAHDAYPIYQLLKPHDTGAVIDLNERNQGHIQCQGIVSLNKDGVPLCPAGHIMAYAGYDRSRQRHKWRCPRTRKKWKVTCDSPCSSSAYGRVFYTREQDNLRLFTRIARGFDQWKARYKRRTAAERFNKRMKEDYLLERRGKIRSSRAWAVRSFLSS